MTDTATYEANLLSAQQSLQQANTDVFNANASPYNNAALQNDVNTNQAQTQATFNTDTANLISSETSDSLAGITSPTLPGLAPSSAVAPVTVDPGNGIVTAFYGTPSLSQITNEAIAKVVTTGTAALLSSITPSIGVRIANGSALAVNNTTGISVANMGVVNVGNSTASGTLPDSSSDQTQNLKVTISQQPVLSGDAAGNTVVFDVMPSIAESRSADYSPFTPIQHPGEILKYKGSSSREWGIGVKLISRNVSEATDNLRKINLIRSWVMPFYGTGTASSASQYLGAPPPILTLKAYGSQMIGPVTTVMTTYSWSWPNEVDYIQTTGGAPFPVIMDISITLKEAYSPAEYSKFDLIQYRNGYLPQAFGGVVSTQMSAQGQSQTAPMTANSVDTSSPQSATQSTVASASASANAAQAAGSSAFLPNLSQPATSYGVSTPTLNTLFNQAPVL